MKKILQLFQKGQAIVEFALIITPFLMLTFGTIYGGMMMADYLALKQYSGSAVKLVTKTGTVPDDVKSNKPNLMLFNLEDNNITATKTTTTENTFVTLSLKATVKENTVPSIVSALIPENGITVKSAPEYKE